MQDHAVVAMRLAVALVVPLDPGFHLGVLVGGVIVDDRVQAHPDRRLPVEVFEERQPLPMRMPGGGLAEYLAVEVRQRGEQGDGAVALVVVRLRAAVAAHDGKAGLGAFQGLALAFLVATQHQRPVRRVQVQPDHVPELPLEVLVVGQFERPRRMGLDVVGGSTTVARSPWTRRSPRPCRAPTSASGSAAGALPRGRSARAPSGRCSACAPAPSHRPGHPGPTRENAAPT